MFKRYYKDIIKVFEQCFKGIGEMAVNAFVRFLFELVYRGLSGANNCSASYGRFGFNNQIHFQNKSSVR